MKTATLEPVGTESTIRPMQRAVSKLSPTLFHVGYHKTGTTWMQHFFFTAENGFCRVLDHDEAFELIAAPHGLDFRPEAARELLTSRHPGDGVVVPVVSSEILCGNPFFGGRESDDYARRIKAINPDAMILITIREQYAAIASTYMQYLSRGGTETLDAFFAERPVRGTFGFSHRHFEYDKLIGLYRDLFGAERVLVVTQESLAADPLAATRHICAFAGAMPPRDLRRDRFAVSYPEYAAWVLRRINYVRSGPVKPAPAFHLGRMADLGYRAAGRLSGLPALRRRLSTYRPVRAFVVKRFAGCFAQSNQRLLAMLGSTIDLDGYDGIHGPEREADAGRVPAVRGRT